MISINLKLDALTETQNQTLRDILDNSTKIESLETDFASIQYENKQLRQELDLVKATVASQSEDIEMLKRECMNQKARSMRQNILVHRIPEEKDEDCEAKVRAVLQNAKYPHAYGIEIAHRLGLFWKATLCRPIVYKLESLAQVEKILKFAARKEDIKITPQFPTELRERRNELRGIADDQG